MPATAVRALSGITDKRIRDLFEILGEITQREVTFQITGIRGTVKLDDNRLGPFIKEDAGLIKKASTGGHGFQIDLTTYSIATGENGSQSPHPFYATIVLSIGDYYSHNQSQQVPPDEETALKCNIEIGRFVKKHQLDAGALGQPQSKLIEPHLALISKIEASSTEQIARINEYFVEMTERFDARNAALNDHVDARRSELEAEFAAKQDQLELERTKLLEEQKALDDRTNTHARRAIRGELLTTLQKRQASFSVSRDTRSLRWPIHLVFIVLIVSTFVGTAWSLYVWGVSSNDVFGTVAITSAIKSVVFTFGFLTTAGLYVSWMNRWFDKHADAQFQTKQFEIDINRASWAVEAALEWKGIQGEQMPDALLMGITKHLFETSPADNTEYSPLEALASSILGSASNLNLDVNGSKIAFDRKSIASIKKAE
ncbi:hypothetical protein Q8W71_15565 [Methylobacterium sp. NEAU 140]|uniref:hypothetical protein n=1 Tax=Methylobacterium sp. NEAU 140 TaxID=3064945 RepID=UPI002735BB20|nr:hypothetical protein [Methylobacterium sp. NEAU 140]MDP4024047.1 hypothetical protein [Methylobacterium sp. NEAU 140]